MHDHDRVAVQRQPDRHRGPHGVDRRLLRFGIGVNGQKQATTREAYTPCLWVMEGVTSHYDRFALRSSGRITAKSYLEKVLDDYARLMAVPGRTRQSLEYTIRLAEGGVSEMKALLFSLRPDALEEGGLIAALTQHAHALEARHGLKVHAELREEPALSPDAQAAAYRVAQEALHNTVKHARAGQVWLSVTQDATHVTLSVRDDGRGFDVTAQGRGTLGQRSMRERAAGAGGTLEVLSGPGQGTRVTLTLPATRPEESA